MIEEGGNDSDNRPSNGRPLNRNADLGNFRAQTFLFVLEVDIVLVPLVINLRQGDRFTLIVIKEATTVEALFQIETAMKKTTARDTVVVPKIF